jgi:hypothetical protein
MFVCLVEIVLNWAGGSMARVPAIIASPDLEVFREVEKSGRAIYSRSNLKVGWRCSE